MPPPAADLDLSTTEGVAEFTATIARLTPGAPEFAEDDARMARLQAMLDRLPSCTACRTALTPTASPTDGSLRLTTQIVAERSAAEARAASADANPARLNDRLARLVEAMVDNYKDPGIRVALAIAASNVRRGRFLTDKEKLLNLTKAIEEELPGETDEERADNARFAADIRRACGVDEPADL